MPRPSRSAAPRRRSSPAFAATQPTKPPANESPAPVGSTASGVGEAGRPNSRRGEHRGAVLALLGDDRVGVHLRGPWRGGHRLGSPVSWRTPVVEQHGVDDLDRLDSESCAMSIHRFIESIATKRAPSSLLAHVALEVRLDVGQEQGVGGPGGVGQLGSKCSKTLRSVRSVWRMLTSRGGRPRRTSCRPRRARCRRCSPRGRAGRRTPLAEVVADRPDHPGLGEERGGHREVHGGAAEHLVALVGRLDRVERDRSTTVTLMRASQRLS